MFLRRGKSLCQRLVLHCNLEAGVPITETGSSWIQEHCGKTIRYINQISRSKWATQRDAPDRDRSYGSRMFSGAEAGKETIQVTFTDEKDGSVTTVNAPVGESLLEVAHKNDIDLEGACEGSLACSTCHVIVEDETYYNKLPEPDDDENDMLDLAFGLTDTSRLGCQVIAKPELDGMHVKIPSATRNFAVDGHIPKPH